MKVQGKKVKELPKRALFTGEAMFTVEKVNPTKEELIKMKAGISDKLYKGFKELYDSGDLDKISQLNQDMANKYNSFKNLQERMEVSYKDIIINNSPYTKIEFFMSFNPNEELQVDKYVDKIYVPYRIFISKELSTNRDSTKVQVIDDHNNNAWIPFDASKDAKTLMNKAKKANPDKNYYQSIDSETVRFAKRGEVLIYDFIFNMSTLHRHNPSKNLELSNFVLGGVISKASEVFDSIVDGNFQILNDMIGSNITQHDNGKVAKVGAMLGISIDDRDKENVKFYQELYTSRLNACTFREVYSKVYNEGKHSTRLSKRVYESITNEQYPWRCFWNDSFELKEYDTNSYRPNESSIENIEDDDDDLPF